MCVCVCECVSEYECLCGGVRGIWASVRLGDTLAILIWRETINGMLCFLAVILINDTYVANLYQQWSSLIRIVYAKMYN